MSVSNKIEGFRRAVQLAAEPRRGRPTKFTPERIREITTLIERGKSRQEIAQIIGVTTGTLQVTCSKLGISLRRPRLSNGTGAVPPPQPAGTADVSSGGAPGDARQEVSKDRDQSVAERAPFKDAASRTGAGAETDSLEPVNFAIRVQYRGKERTRQLPLTQEMIGRLAIEAEFLGMKTDELIGLLITAIVEKDMIKAVLEQRPAPTGPADSE